MTLNASKFKYVFAFLFLISAHLQAQVTGVDFQIKYDTVQCRYDCYIIINSGSAISAIHRTQFSSQYSIVVPTGSTVEVAENFMPLKYNQNYTGTDPQYWNVSSTIFAPDTMPQSDFFSITPSLSPVAQFNDLYTGDTVKIFSLNITTPSPTCDDEIRVFRNGIDPPSSAPGMDGGDFSCGYTIGGVSQVYENTAPQAYPPKPVVDNIVVTYNSDINIDLTSITSACQGSLGCVWTGPNNYSGTSEDVFIQNATAANEGMYHVTITDSYGCQETTSAMVENSAPCSSNDHSVKLWNGSIDNNWFNPENWTPCGIPQDISSVYIPPATPNFPFVTTSVTIKALTVHDGGYMELNGPQVTLTVIN